MLQLIKLLSEQHLGSG